MSVLSSSRRDAARWTTAFAIATLAHGGLAVAVLANWQPPETAGAPVLVELEMLAASPDVASAESVPGPEQTKTDDVQPQPEEAVTPPPEPEVEQAALEMPDPVEAPVTVPDPVPVPEAVPPKPVPKREVKKPRKPDPKREVKKPEPDKPETPPRAVAATTARSSADTVASIPSPGRFGQGSSNAMPNWNSRIVAHLQRHKRYPAEAQARGETGVARLHFTIDRSGNVLSSRLAASSGVSSLDRETAALIQRAQPLPQAPPELSGARFSFSVPIRYSFR
ncbi:energy transducer TonB [Blastochloris viridis]|uniref:Ferric siderophore transport system n=1 Tax=Blastochloris viridis TaxID=1079 RepID=A0A0H5BF93_BLAVI|nr:energy transducer TonB [Blastochloris viridis]ALK10292.1 Gram-negative bacterial tonB protein [Blastochloris viridis]BAR99774.1 ferric siderophore transport system [Blastochloris viridis]CUU42954.1 hypothetical protein BVIRIDIS_19700 [Blastochloris viridis]